MKTRLKIENLSIHGKNVTGWSPIVEDVNIEVNSGEVVAIIGQSGVGKTTVALSLLSYTRPGTRITRGRIYLGDQNILSMEPERRRKLRGMRVAYVSQSAAAALNPLIPMGRQVAECLLVHGAASEEAAQERVVELLALMDLPDPVNFARRYPYQASGGQQQRVMVAMAMACRPEFLVFDEPTTALDVTTQIEVLKSIKAVVSKNGTGAVYVSHDLAVVAQIADRIVVMHAGRIAEQGRVANILGAPSKGSTRALIKAVQAVPGHTARFGAGSQNRLENRSDVLKLKGIRASYAKRSWLRRPTEAQHILYGVDFSIGAGEFVALVGESGSGKSTLARVIAGLLPPVAGRIQFQGTDLQPFLHKRTLEQLRRIQIVFQSPDTTLNPVKRVEEEVGRPLSLYFGLKGEEKRARVEELLEMVELPTGYVSKYPSELSGGEKQRVALARAFAAEPELLLCDEVLSSLDTVVGATILKLLKNLQAKLNVACLFISHDLATVATTADRVVVLYAGRVCEEGSTHEVFNPPFHPYTALLISSVPELRCGWLEDVQGLDSVAGNEPLAGTPLNRGCAFRTRCRHAVQGLCDVCPPPEKNVSGSHVVYCHREKKELPAITCNRKGILN